MTSQINYTAIDATYPVAGQDNDSQGFRDNFAATQSALATAKTEITALQTNAVLVASLDGNDTVDNNLLGSSINNGSYSEFYGISYGTITVNTNPWSVTASNGYLQSFSASSSFGLTFTGWPDSGLFAKVRVHITNSGPSNITVSIDGETIVKSNEFPTALTVPTGGAPIVIEAWTLDGGTTVYVHNLGVFDTASNNRTILGDLSVAGDTTMVQVDAASINVSGLTNLADVSAENLETTGDVTVQGILTANSTVTLGGETADKITFTGVPKLPNISTIERNALTAEVGMMIYNISTGKAQVCTTAGSSGTAVWADLH
jgi:hypothetical protein